MKEKVFKPIAKKLLKELGFEVVDILSRKGSKTPDFDVRGKNNRYTIELKIKTDDPEESKRESEALARGEMIEKSVPAGRRNRLYGIIKDGVQQMDEYHPQHDTFHVIWLHSEGRDAQLLNTRFQATLFGTQDLFSMGRKNLITCFYFHESIFYSFRNSLDGAILTYHDKLQLCINTLSPHLQKFRASELYKTLEKGLCDPEIKISEGVMIADCSLDRKESNKIMDYLRSKYKLNHPTIYKNRRIYN